MKYLLTILPTLIAGLVLTSTAHGDEPRYDPNPIFSSDQASVAVEIESPRQVFLPSNSELFNRIDALCRSGFSSKWTDSHAVLMKIQRDYDSYICQALGIDNIDEPELLSKLRWIPEVSEKTPSGKPVTLTLKLRNESDHEISFYKSLLFGLNFIVSSIRLTRIDENRSPVVLRGLGAAYLGYPGLPGHTSFAPIAVAPGESGTLMMYNSARSFDLAELFDLDEPGEYELTFYTRRFIDDAGNPAADQVRPFPLQNTVRFTILPASEETVRRDPLVFKYDSIETFTKETHYPAPTPPPTNIELQARFLALNKVVPHADWLSKTLSWWSNFYNSRLSAMTDKLGLARQEARTELYSGLKWRPLVPKANVVGKPIIMRLGLENVSEHEKYCIRNVNAFNAPMVLASLRIIQTDAERGKKEVSFTSEGSRRFYKLTDTHGMDGILITNDSLFPGELYTGFIIYDGFGCSEFDLTKYYDLSKPGEYELTFYTRRFVNEDGSPADDMVRPYPMPDTVRFTISKDPLYP